MILPIVAYGTPVLKKMAEDITKDYEGLDELIENMWATMYNARGVGLAAPQVGLGIRLFVVDSTQLDEEDEEDEEPTGIKKVFINAKILKEEGKPWFYEEGCLSIPDIRENVNRNEIIKIRYYDEDFNVQEEVFDGVNARVIQHEYDHIEGILFTDHLKPLKRRLLRKKLDNISKGKIKISYKMRFPLGR